MITIFGRSSSLNTWDDCQHKFFMEYVLGYKFPAGHKAALGTTCHKCFEVMGSKKLAQQNGQSGYEDDAFGWLNNEDITWDWVIKASYDYYREQEPFHKWNEFQDLKKIKAWTNRVRTEHDGYFNPENLNIVAIEKTFSIEIPDEWASYHFVINDFELKGQLTLKGTMDMLFTEVPGTLSYLDWKTGSSKDWVTGKEKTFQSLMKDFQLLLYLYALWHCYPESEYIMMNIHFLQHNGVFSLPFEKGLHIDYFKSLLKNKFEKIKACQKPRLNRSWKCSKVCGHNRPYKDTGLTYCEFVEKEVKAKGVDQVFYEIGDKDSIGRYGSGGGKVNTEM